MNSKHYSPILNFSSPPWTLFPLCLRENKIPILALFFCFFPVFLYGQEYDREALLISALRNNNSLQRAASQSREARSLLSEARAARLPVLRFSSNLSYMTNPPNITIQTGSLFPGGNFPVTIPPPMPLTLDIPFPPLPSEDQTIRFSENARYEFGLTLEQPVFTWGRINNSIQAASLGSQAALLQQEQERRNVITLLDSHLYSLAYLSEMQTLLVEQRQRAQRLIALSEESHASGFLLRTDVLSARLLLSEIALGELTIAENMATSLLAIQSLTGLSDLTMTSLVLPDGEGSLTNRFYNRSDKDRLLSGLFEKNLSLKMLDIQTRAFIRQLAAQKGRSYGKPELGLFFQLTYGGSAFPFVDNSMNMTAALGIRSLLIDGGTMRHGIRQKEENLIQVKLEEEKGRRDLVEFLERSLIQLEISRQRQVYINLKAETDYAKMEQAGYAWRTGYGEERDVLTHELNWYNNRINLLQEELNALLLVLRLENVLGE